MRLLGPRGEADQVVDNDVHRPAGRIALQVGQVQRLGPDALAGEGGIAVQLDEQHVRAPQRHRIHSFQMTGIGDQVNADFAALARAIFAGRTDVVLHVAATQHAVDRKSVV